MKEDEIKSQLQQQFELLLRDGSGALVVYLGIEAIIKDKRGNVI